MVSCGWAGGGAGIGSTIVSVAGRGPSFVTTTYTISYFNICNDVFHIFLVIYLFMTYNFTIIRHHKLNNKLFIIITLYFVYSRVDGVACWVAIAKAALCHVTKE